MVKPLFLISAMHKFLKRMENTGSVGLDQPAGSCLIRSCTIG